MGGEKNMCLVAKNEVTYLYKWIHFFGSNWMAVLKTEDGTDTVL